MAELQVIPARHGTATFVPAGQIIKIINTSGTQVVDTWAFALPKPEPKKDAQAKKGAEKEESKTPAQTPAKKKSGMNLPSQEDAENATQEGLKQGEQAATPQKSTWSSYVPSIGWSSGTKGASKDAKQETEQQKDSKTWASYFPSGKGFSNYVPQVASDTVTNFAATHQRDPKKSYMEQLQDFSKTPVGAAGWSALSGSGYGGSLLSGYQAWNAKNAANAIPMEFMSMPHSRAAMLHLRPRVDDTLVSNLREPIMTLVEDTSSGIHDTLIAACDPARYKGLGVENWHEHGSCAENLVLALSELNERAGLKGAKGVGADVTINSVPAPLNLFMNIPWDDQGDIGFNAPKSKKEGFVRFKAERDIVVVMSACPQDILDINNKSPTDAHFIVEGEEEPAPAVKRQYRKRPPPRKISSSHATSTIGTADGVPPYRKPIPQKRAVPQKKATTSTAGATAQKAPTTAAQPAQKAQTTTAQPVKKKPAPAPVTAQKKKAPMGSVKPLPGAANTATTNGTAATNNAATPVERKKPRKLTPKPKPEAATAA